MTWAGCTFLLPGVTLLRRKYMPSFCGASFGGASIPKCSLAGRFQASKHETIQRIHRPYQPELYCGKRGDSATYVTVLEARERIATPTRSCASAVFQSYPPHYDNTMSAGIPKSFWSSPFRYLKWASYEKPAIFYSVIVGAMGPVFLLTIPPLRRLAGDEKPARIPLSYPGK